VPPPPTTRQREIRLEATPVATCRALASRDACSVLLDGSGGFAESWHPGPLLAVDPTRCLQVRCRAPGDGVDALRQLGELVARRRSSGGTAETGVVALLDYDLLRSFGATSAGRDGLPDLVAFDVDRSIRFMGSARALLTDRENAEDSLNRLLAETEARIDPGDARARCADAPRTSLPREAYLRAVDRVQHHIVRGDIYQANLCQRFAMGYEGRPFEVFAELSTSTAAPHSAFVGTPEFSLASLSPETFLRMRSNEEIETWPIKGTRPRGATEEADLAAACELQASAKDRAELVMIVDLERNDLSRVCEPGTVRVSELARLRSYAAVHHLVAGVHGTLRADIDVESLIRATFPGGSITGAPKLRAMEILHELEPVRRGFFTGNLFWFGDDGSLDSSILIRTLVFDGRQAYLGAGGGVVADSDAEQEWCESNHKARALAAALGFEPEEAA